MHVELLIEEPSCEAALKLLLPKIGLTEPHTFTAHVFQGKADLLKSLPDRLTGYSKWLPDDWRIVVLVDRDDEDCKVLKAKLEKTASTAKLSTRTNRGAKGTYQVVNRICIEELEAWFFGDVEALCKAYSRVPPTLDKKSAFRDPDAVSGGTWERLERGLKDAGHYAAGLPKIEAARRIAEHMEPERNRSKSFRVFRDAVRELINA